MNNRILVSVARSVLFLSIASCSAPDNTAQADDTAYPPREALSGEQILSAFSDVIDQADIQDEAGTTAVNQWHSDGRFVNRWKNAADSGEVIGTWRVVGDQRCVLISAGLEGAIGKEKCSPVFKSGERYMSVNADGSIHAFHTLRVMLEKP